MRVGRGMDGSGRLGRCSASFIRRPSHARINTSARHRIAAERSDFLGSASAAWRRHAAFAVPLGMESWAPLVPDGPAGWWLLGAGAAVALGVGFAVLRHWWRGRPRTEGVAESPIQVIPPPWRAAVFDCFSDSFGRQSRGRVRLRHLMAPLGIEERRRIANALVISFLRTDGQILRALSWILCELVGSARNAHEAVATLLPAPEVAMPGTGAADVAFRRIMKNVHQVLVRALLWSDNASRALDGTRTPVVLAGSGRDVPALHRAMAELRLFVRQIDATAAAAVFAQSGPPPAAAVERIVQATIEAALIPVLPARVRLTAVLPLLDRWVAGEAWVGQEVAPLLTLFSGGEALTIARRLELGLAGPEGVRIAVAMLHLIPRLRPGKRSAMAMAVVTRLAASPDPLTPSAVQRSSVAAEGATARDDLTQLAAEIPNESLPVFLDGVARLLGPKTLNRLLPIIEMCWPRVKPMQRGPIALALARTATESGLRLRSGAERDAMAAEGSRADGMRTDGERIATLVAQSPAQDVCAVFDALIRLRQRRRSGLLWDLFDSQCFMLMGPLKRHERMVVTALFIERYGLAQLPLRIVASLLRPVGGATFLEFATARGDLRLLIAARYAMAGLPWERGFWGEYEQSGWSERWLAETGERVEHYRRGGALHDVTNATEQRRAFAGLDQPKGLTFEAFVSALRPAVPPPAWLPRPWTMQVPEVVSSWAQLDLRALQADVEQLQQWVQVADIQTLFAVARSWQRVSSLASVVRFVPPMNARESHRPWVIARVQALITAGVLQADGVATWLRSALIWLAWQEETAAGLRAAIEPLLQPHLRIGMPTRLAGMRAMEELLRDRLADSAQACGVAFATLTEGPTAPLAEVRALRERLAEHLQRGAARVLRTVTVDVVPSRSQADRCIHYVVDDCTGSRAIDSPDFQLTRLVADRRLGGALYLERARLANTDLRVLICAPEPRPEWSIDYDAFLAELERTLPEQALAEGFAAVVFMADTQMQTNRLDLLDAILLRRFPAATWPLRFGHPSIFHWDFPERNRPAHPTSVLVLWQNPAHTQVLRRFTAVGLGPRHGADLLNVELPVADVVLPPQWAVARAPVHAVAEEPAVEPIMAVPELEEIELDLTFDDPEGPLPVLIEQQGVPPVAPGARELRRRPLPDILRNPRVIRTDRGWIEPTLEGKTHVIDAEHGWETLPATGTEVTPQDLFDFHTVVFHQAHHFHAFLRVLQRLGADVQPLAPIIGDLDDALAAGLRALLEGAWPEALRAFQGVDALVGTFRVTMRGIANTVDIDVDPITGAISPLPAEVRALLPPVLLE